MCFYFCFIRVVSGHIPRSNSTLQHRADATHKEEGGHEVRTRSRVGLYADDVGDNERNHYGPADGHGYLL